MKNLFLILALCAISSRILAQKLELGLTIDPNPKFIEDVEFSFGIKLQDEIHANFFYETFQGWSNFGAGLDCNILNEKSKFSLRPGFNYGYEVKRYTCKIYLKSEFILTKWLDLVAVGVYSDNSRGQYYESRIGISFNFN